jgi:protein-S-isoprenylcysteine O-methyltransferase Ste14
MALQEEFEKQGNFLFRYRGGLPLIFLVLGIGAYVFTLLTSTGFAGRGGEDVYRLACLAVSFTGLVVRVITVGRTPRNTSGRNTSGQLADELNTTGIYSIVRHPLYLGNFFMWAGVAMLTENLWFFGLFVFLYWVYYERIMFAEEQFLRRKFGEAYENWAAGTPAFIPSFRNRIPSRLPFSWKKVIKSEKNGFFEIFLVFYVFQCAGDFIRQGRLFTMNWLFYAAAGSLVLYLVLKILKKKTGVLDEPGR